MEMLDIVDENGNPTGKVKRRDEVHRDGDPHRTSHVWIVRDNEKGGLDVLLQKRSDNKDSHPGCLDISSAGHIKAGDDFLESALRELKEELGIEASPEELKEIGISRTKSENIFHGEIFKNNQISKVYKLKLNNLDIDKLKLQEEEVQGVLWMDLEECKEAVENNTIKNCIKLHELQMLG
ncbi:MAG: NUDIX domain-containing protein [Clostridium sp.]|uniref:NUDIX hydrolase n=1 Tax=Clostridium sp. DSM 8431 TaxID=1761781 RepID=UPI0008E8EB54|nr:NUDIX domain-containing protein [Clostridium sp. DSM 8431]MCR4943320.1 NUDIX domain-containing protein [Clostridium sp.]SFU59808.1 Isopentenyldiphosphate isomerase [Clostridium sp. DSM 8431]